MAEADYTLPSTHAPEPGAPTPEGVYVHSPDHAAKAIAHLIDFFRKPRNSKLVGTMAEQFQQLEDAIWDVYLKCRLVDPQGGTDHATGVQLDVIGAELGEARGNRTDEPYRAALLVRILVNISDGKPAQLYAIARGMLPDVAQRLVAKPPASMVMFLNDLFTDVTPASVAAMLRQAKAGGVRLHTVTYNNATVFKWSASAGTSAAGWGSTADPSVGGKWASVY